MSTSAKIKKFNDDYTSCDPIVYMKTGSCNIRADKDCPKSCRLQRANRAKEGARRNNSFVLFHAEQKNEGDY